MNEHLRFTMEPGICQLHYVLSNKKFYIFQQMIKNTISKCLIQLLYCTINQFQSLTWTKDNAMQHKSLDIFTASINRPYSSKRLF